MCCRKTRYFLCFFFFKLRIQLKLFRSTYTLSEKQSSNQSLGSNRISKYLWTGRDLARPPGFIIQKVVRPSCRKINSIGRESGRLFKFQTGSSFVNAKKTNCTTRAIVESRFVDTSPPPLCLDPPLQRAANCVFRVQLENPGVLSRLDGMGERR